MLAKLGSRNFPRKVLLNLLAIALVLLVVHVSLKFVSIALFDQKHGFLFELSNRFDVNDENSVPQWFSQTLFLLIGVAAGLAGYLQRQATPRRIWYVIATLGVLLSLDDAAMLHEFALQMIHNTFFFGKDPSFLLNAWWILLPFVFIPGAIVAWLGWKHLPKRTIAIVVSGAAVYLVGKVLMDSIANNVSDLFLERGLVQGAEKLFQYTGSSVVLFAVLDYLRQHHSAQILRATEQLKPSKPGG